MTRIAFVIRHPFVAYRFVRACRAPWPTIGGDCGPYRAVRGGA